MGTLTTISRYVNSAFRAAGLAAVVALSGCSNGSSTPPPPPGGTLEEKGINLTPDTSEVVTEMDEGGEEISYAKDKVLVQVAAGTKNADLETLLQQVNGQITGHIQPLNWYEIQVQDAKTALPAIRQHPLVQNAELNYAGAVEELDVDAPGLSEFAWGHHKIKLSEAYEFIGNKSLANVTVAVLDSGFDLEHPELATQFLPGVDVGSVDDNPTYEDISEDLSKARTHGTSVAGIIAMLNNGKDLNGVAYNAKILPVKVSASTALGKAAEGAAVNTVLAFKLAAGITYATLEGADVINMSIGWQASSPSWLLQSAVEYAQAAEVSLVASAGNENKEAQNHHPSVLDGVISVGATTEDDKRWTYSESTGSNYSLNNNSKVLTVAAPGEDIWSAAAGERGELAITPGTGTSLAAPFVSGLDALVKSLKPSLSAEERQQIIIDSADEIKVAYPELDYPNVQGNKTWKRINAYNAVVLAETGCNPAQQICGGTGNKCEGKEPGPHEEWTVSYNGLVTNSADAGSAIAIDLEGNIYVTGYTTTLQGSLDIWINKYGPNGNQLWSNPKIVGSSTWDVGEDITTDPLGNIYIIGTYNNTQWGDNNYIWINKYDKDGNQIWDTSISRFAEYGSYGNNITIDTAGNIYVIGDIYRTVTTGYEIWINKYDTNGNQSWSNPLIYNGPTDSSDRGYGIAVDLAGNIYAVGTTGHFGEYNLWINKYAPNGSMLWSDPTYYNGSSNKNDEGRGIVTDLNGNIYVVGFESKLKESQNIWINKYDSNGNQLWGDPISHNGSANSYDSGKGIAIDSAGNIYVIGTEIVSGEGGNIFIDKYNSEGNALWNNPISYNDGSVTSSYDNKDDYGSDIIVDSAGNIYVIGTTHTLEEDENIWLRKYFQCN